MSTDFTNGDDLNDQRNGNDVELRELVYQSLERDGLITRLKAELRVAVFKTIEKATNPSDSQQKPAYDSVNGRICCALVLDWLEHSRLLYTKDILKVETSGSHHPPPLTNSELLDKLHLNSQSAKPSIPILHTLLDQDHHHRVNSLPEHVKQSIDTKFPSEKINDISRVREHFRSLFSSAFDSSVLDAFLNQHMPSSSSSIAKIDYEQICLKWLQACAKASQPQTSPIKQTPPTVSSTQPLTSRSIVTNTQTVTQARRSTSPPSESTSSSSASENPRKGAYDFPLPTTLNANRTVTKKPADALPLPPLLNLHSNSTNDEDEDDTNSSIFSKRHATPAALNHLKNIEDIIRGDETPRTRTTLDKISNNIHKDIPVEYDDESFSQSQVSSIDDITVDKASPSPSAQMDFFDDL